MESDEIKKACAALELLYRQSPREDQYASFVNIRNTELATYWTRFNIQAALNLGLIVAVFSLKPDSLFYDFRVPASIAGFAFSFIWLWMTFLGKMIIIKRWDKYIRQYEKCFSKELFPLFISVEDEEKNRKWKRFLVDLTIPALLVPLTLMFLWFFVIYTFYGNPFLPRSQEVISLKSAIQRLSLKNAKLISEIEFLKSKTYDSTRDIPN